MRHDVFEIGPITITSTVVNTWLIMLVLFTLVWLVTRRGFSVTKPGRVQIVLEMLVKFLYTLSDNALGRKGRKYLPIYGTLFLFIIFLNLSWFIPGLIPPTTDLMTTAALAIVTVALVQIVGVRELGVGAYLRRFTRPMVIMAPMNLIEEVVKPFGLAIRLFGNMFGEESVVLILAILVPVVAPVPVMFLGLIMGTIQAFVFALLSITYIATACAEH